MKTQNLRLKNAWKGAGLSLVLVGVLCLLFPGRGGAVGSWGAPINEPSGVTIEQMILLSNGSVMGQDSSNGETNWWQLIPNTNGSYLNGSWKQLRSMHYARNAYGKVMLNDGRVMVVGDENDHNGATAEIYDPVADSWTNLPTAGVGFADCDCVLLWNGTVLVSPVSWLPYAQDICTIYSPSANSWSFPSSSLAYQNEASWVMLPDQSILTIDDNTNTSERFIQLALQWVPDSSVPVNIYSHGEMGPAFLLPDGRAFFLGGTGHTALYTPSPLGGINPGTWARGPDIPDGRVTADAPGAMMCNGKVLCAVGPSAADGGSPAPTWFYEYDYTDLSAGPNGTFVPTSSPDDSTIGSSNNVPSNQLSFLDLPNGHILCCSYNKNQLAVYIPDLSPLAAGKPVVSSVSWNRDGTLHLTGKLFNGISQGAAFGDEGQDASNYPLVSFSDGSGDVYYGRTFGWSSTGVQTGNALVATEVKPPPAVFNAPGIYSLRVIANGIASDPVTFYSPVWVNFNYSGSVQNGTLTFPYSKLVLGISAVATNGTIAINANIQPSDSSETMTISKPVTITSVSGPSIIGH